MKNAEKRMNRQRLAEIRIFRLEHGIPGFRRAATLGIVITILIGSASADEGSDFFEAKVRPILVLCQL